uniref:Uncharacterized protein n=1 Tax=Monopterus albus TaxID=43700 RepID=A0A3Q3IDL3_MONAL
FMKHHYRCSVILCSFVADKNRRILIASLKNALRLLLKIWTRGLLFPECQPREGASQEQKAVLASYRNSFKYTSMSSLHMSFWRHAQGCFLTFWCPGQDI